MPHCLAQEEQVDVAAGENDAYRIGGVFGEETIEQGGDANRSGGLDEEP